MIKISYSGYRFPPEIIQHAIWLYIRLTLSFRDVEDLLAERGTMVSYETARRWVNHFGPMVAAGLRKRGPKPHTTWHLDEVYLKIDGRMVCGAPSTPRARSSTCWSRLDQHGLFFPVYFQDLALLFANRSARICKPFPRQRSPNVSARRPSCIARLPLTRRGH